MFGITTDYEYSATHKRQKIDIWEGPWFHSWAGEGYSVKDGFSIVDYHGNRFRVKCANRRTEDNYLAVDAAINAAMVEHLGREAS